MRSSPKSPSRSRSSTDRARLALAPPLSIALAIPLAIPLVLLALASACGDDDCGPGDAPASGVTASSAEVTLTYGELTSLVGNDCPAPDAPEGVISLSIEGRQVDGPGLITLCIPRPDLLDSTPRMLGPIQSSADAQVVDLTGEADGCSYAIDPTSPPTGSVIGSGVCGNGDDAAGFALDFDGAVSLTRTCGGATDQIDVTLTGRVAVHPRAP